jgi:uncharacterized protein
VRFSAFILAAALSGCANSLLLYPTTHPIGTQATRHVLADEDGELELWKIASEEAKASPDMLIVSYPGNGDRAERSAPYEASLWRGKAVEIWTLNYPGYGKSSGSAALSLIPGAALAAYDEVRRIAAGRPVLVSGDSLGTAAALHVAAHRPVDGVILRNPPPLRSLIMGRYGWWNLWLAASVVALQVPSELDSLGNGAKASAPAIFIQATEDNTVPPAYQQDVIDAYRGEKVVVRFAGGHNGMILGVDELKALSEAFHLLEAKARSEPRNNNK